MQSHEVSTREDKKATSSLDAWLEKEGIVWEEDDKKFRRRLLRLKEPVSSGATDNGDLGKDSRKRKRDWDEKAKRETEDRPEKVFRREFPRDCYEISSLPSPPDVDAEFASFLGEERLGEFRAGTGYASATYGTSYATASGTGFGAAANTYTVTRPAGAPRDVGSSSEDPEIPCCRTS